MKVRLRERPHVTGTAREVRLGILGAPGLGAPHEVVMRFDDVEGNGAEDTIPIVDVEVYVTRRAAWRSLAQALGDEDVSLAMDVERNRAELFEPDEEVSS